jgi:hypothetical protein
MPSPAETLEDAEKPSVIHDQERSIELLEKKTQSEVEDEDLRPNTPMNLGLVTSPIELEVPGIGDTDTKSSMDANKQRAMTTPNQAVSSPPIPRGITPLHSHQSSISELGVGKRTTSGRTPLPTRAVPSSTSRSKPEKRKSLASPECSFVSGQSTKKSKIPDPKLGPKEKPPAPYVNSLTNGPRRRRIQPDTELDVEVDIFGPELLRLAKRSKMAATGQNQLRPRKPKKENLREKVGDQNIKRGGQARSAPKKSSKFKLPWTA